MRGRRRPQFWRAAEIPTTDELADLFASVDAATIRRVVHEGVVYDGYWPVLWPQGPSVDHKLTRQYENGRWVQRVRRTP